MPRLSVKMDVSAEEKEIEMDIEAAAAAAVVAAGSEEEKASSLENKMRNENYIRNLSTLALEKFDKKFLSSERLSRMNELSCLEYYYPFDTILVTVEQRAKGDAANWWHLLRPQMITEIQIQPTKSERIAGAPNSASNSAAVQKLIKIQFDDICEMVPPTNYPAIVAKLISDQRKKRQSRTGNLRESITDHEKDANSIGPNGIAAAMASINTTENILTTPTTNSNNNDDNNTQTPITPPLKDRSSRGRPIKKNNYLFKRSYSLSTNGEPAAQSSPKSTPSPKRMKMESKSNNAETTMTVVDTSSSSFASQNDEVDTSSSINNDNNNINNNNNDNDNDNENENEHNNSITTTTTTTTTTTANNNIVAARKITINKYRCGWVRYMQRCGYETPDKESMIAHVRSHPKNMVSAVFTPEKILSYVQEIN